MSSIPRVPLSTLPAAPLSLASAGRPVERRQQPGRPWGPTLPRR